MRFASRIATISGAIGLTVALSAQPSPTEQKASLEGVVLNAATQVPVRQANVYLSRLRADPAIVFDDIAPKLAVTDSSGKFVFRDVDPGSYQLSAHKPGFAHNSRAIVSGADRPIRKFEIKPGERQTGARVELTPHGAISGIVVDEDGEPVTYTLVSALRPQYIQGRRQLTATASQQTDDRGAFRLHNLAPGRYVVSVQPSANLPPPGEQRLINVQTYYPGVTDPSQAQKITVTPGGDVRGVQLRHAKAHTYRVKGRVLDESGKPIQNFALALSHEYGAQVPVSQGSLKNRPGEFELYGIPPGSYWLTAHSATYSPNRQRQQTRRLQVTSSDIEDVEIRMAARVTIAGEVLIPPRAGSSPAAVHVWLISPEGIGAGQAGPSDAEGKLTIEDVAAGVARLQVSPGNGEYFVESIFYGDEDVTNKQFMITDPSALLRIVLGSGATPVRATVVQAKEPSEATALLLPTGRWKGDAQRLRLTSPAETGAVTFSAVAPGEYLAFAFREIEYGLWEDPAFLETLESKGVKVSVTKDGMAPIELPLLTLPESLQPERPLE